MSREIRNKRLVFVVIKRRPVSAGVALNTRTVVIKKIVAKISWNKSNTTSAGFDQCVVNSETKFEFDFFMLLMGNS